MTVSLNQIQYLLHHTIHERKGLKTQTYISIHNSLGRDKQQQWHPLNSGDTRLRKHGYAGYFNHSTPHNLTHCKLKKYGNKEQSIQSIKHSRLISLSRAGTKLKIINRRTTKSCSHYSSQVWSSHDGFTQPKY